MSVDLPRRPACSGGRDLVERALAPDLTYQRVGGVLRAAYDPPFFATYFYGLDVVGHAFMRFARPDAFGDVTPEEVRRYGHVIDRYLALLSQWIGDVERALRPGEILLVVSGYGMEPAPLWRRDAGAGSRASRLSGEPTTAPPTASSSPWATAYGPAARRPRRVGPRRGADDPVPDGAARRAGHGGTRA